MCVYVYIYIYIYIYTYIRPPTQRPPRRGRAPRDPADGPAQRPDGGLK